MMGLTPGLICWTLLIIFKCFSGVTSESVWFQKTYKFYDEVSKAKDDRTADVIKYDGYPVETHLVTTADGYVLTALRIPSGKKKAKATKGPVLLMPGFLMTAASWLLVSPERSLPYMLADHGYDVWLATFRGNPLSSGHVKYTQDNIEYWDFSFDELGIYDVPALIDLALSKTGKARLITICISLGCSDQYIALATNVTYGDKILATVNLGPAMYVMNVKGTFWRAMPKVFKQLKLLAQSFSKREPRGKLRSSDNLLKLMVHRCNTGYKICLSPLMNELGFVASKQNDTTYFKYASLVKPSVSIRMAIQIMDVGYVGKFIRFDYGDKKNVKLYGNEKPPTYNLSLVRVPSTLTVYSKKDRTTVVKDVLIFQNELPSGPKYRKSLYLVKDPIFTHTDLFLHDQVDKLVYNHVIDFLDKEEKLAALSIPTKKSSENKPSSKSKGTIDKGSSKNPDKKSKILNNYQSSRSVPPAKESKGTPKKTSSKSVNNKSKITTTTKGSSKGKKT